MSHLTDTRLKELKDKLLEEKRELEAHFAQEEDDESLLDSTGELSSYDNHPADIGTETFERSRDQAVDRNLEEELEQIGAALARMQSGEYGTCAVCGKPIPFERLQAVPYSPYCTRHADEARRGEAAPGRPVEEQVMTPPPTGAGRTGDGVQGGSTMRTRGIRWKATAIPTAPRWRCSGMQTVTTVCLRTRLTARAKWKRWKALPATICRASGVMCSRRSATGITWSGRKANGWRTRWNAKLKPRGDNRRNAG
ncbi:TraR/DksA C4-type zinc finger protein [Paenibacillus sp. P26]|nr:TraR/DksA C4-type zinc finger protein [Paenibacillus sp. P26]